MDHLPRPTNAVEAQIEVPLLEFPPYDFLAFDTFPERQGLKVNGELNYSRATSDLASLAQSWLYFGLLSEVLGRHVTPHGFTRAPGITGSEKSVLDSSWLTALFDEWQTQLRGSTVEDCDERLELVHKTIDIAVLAVLRYDQACPSDDEQFCAVMLSVKLLLVTIIHVYNGLYPRNLFSLQDKRLMPQPSSTASPPASARILMKRMTQAGFCPQVIRRICSSYNVVTAYYLLQLPRLRRMDHSQCSETRCIASNVDNATYKTQHTQPGCQCQHILVDVKKVNKIVEDGDIPLCRTTVRKSGYLKLDVQPSRQRNVYVVFSHVWSDGLGNPQANSLPHCQLVRLHDLVKTQGAHGRFWIDTLCVPVGEAYKPIRRMAINSMASIYQDAKALIVIDGEVRQVTRTHTEIDFLAYILGSVWNCRCWTYQEAVLGKVLYFDTVEGVQKTPIVEVNFLPDLTSGYSGLRWFLWRLLKRPLSHLSRTLGFFVTFLPLTSIVTISFRLYCGPQAWRIFLRAIKRAPNDTYMLQDRLTCVLFGSLALICAAVFTITSIPASIFLLLLVLAASLASILLASCLWLAEGIEPVSTEVLLRQQLQLQLSWDLRSEMQPTRTRTGVAPELAATQRSQRFAHVWNALVERTATKFEDLHIILASLTETVPFRITELKTPAARMRAVVSVFEKLPLALLFNQVAEEHRDPCNRWLPLAPMRDLLPVEQDAASMRINGDQVEVRLSDLRDSAFAVRVKERSVNQGDVYVTIDNEWEFEDGSHNAQSEADKGPRYCLLVDTKQLGRSNDSVKPLRAARLAISTQDGDTWHCVYDKPLSVIARKQIRDEKDYHFVPMTDPETLNMPFSREDLTASNYRQQTGAYENWTLINLFFFASIMSTVVILAITASQTKASVFYIGLPALWFAVAIPGLPVLRFAGRLSQARFDERQAKFANSWGPRLVNEWLVCVAENFAQGEGGPKRWWEWLSSHPPWGKFS